jgi:peptide/nickel transport system permease protein
MSRFVVRRFLQALIVLFFASIFTFLNFQVIPNGNPALRLAGRTATPETIAAITRAWGFDKPIYVQYFDTMEKIFTGSVVSYSQQVNVLSQIRQGLPATASLAIGASIIWLLWGIGFGLLSALRPRGIVDRGLAAFSLTAISMPVFVVGSVLLYALAFRTSVFPNGGYVPLTQSVSQWFIHMVLPWFTLSLPAAGFYSRVFRSNLLETVHQEYVRTARAKGLSRRRLFMGHVVRNSLIPILSLWGLDFAGVIGGGAILTETVFDLHGIGQYAASSIQLLDVPPIMVIVMYAAVAVVVIGAVVDVLYALLDPRILLNA